MFNSDLINFLPHIGGFLILILTIFTAGHVVIYKRDSRAAVGWIGVILIVPVIGAILYVIFGINRIKRKAIRKRRNIEKFVKQTSAFLCTIEYLKDFLPEQKKNLVHLGKVSNQVTRYSLLRGNSIVPLLYGDNAYPKMLEAIDYSSKSISLATYIFNNDIVGDMFINALSDAVKRGVEVRVLIDDVGAHYTFPSVVKKLQQRGIKTKIFMPTLIPWGIPFINLRNHKKILVVDGMIGFTGSMNIQAANVLRNNPRNPIKDAHFEIKGPIVTQVQKIFSEDWFFASKEILSGEKWFPVLKEEGAIISRVINDGPDEDFIKQLKIILGALACAEESVRIVTPYFLPESELISAING
ncbi:MAG: PLDc N-terminal domain-containing protein, partial [Candidatus Omnitrophica bacterium]|nr:PLDc N-terminal domain-containing protein [Candidatus Omnitrophota bacterium]